jgi:hypothetical protein
MCECASKGEESKRERGQRGEQRAESREQRAESREQRAESKGAIPSSAMKFSATPARPTQNRRAASAGSS